MTPRPFARTVGFALAVLAVVGLGTLGLLVSLPGSETGSPAPTSPCSRAMRRRCRSPWHLHGRSVVHHAPSRPVARTAGPVIARGASRPATGGTFAGSDSRSSRVFRLAHLADTMVLVDPDTFADRLEAAGFHDVKVEARKGAFRFRSTVPTTASA